jgi:hypothetical protein
MRECTYVALTSSFAGIGGIVAAVVGAVAMVAVVACSGALFESAFFARLRRPIFAVERGWVVRRRSGRRRGVEKCLCKGRRCERRR